MNNNPKCVKLEDLNINEKNRIMMYTTARQFKNAVPIEEMLILPSRYGDWVNFCNITLNNIPLKDVITKYDVNDSPIELNGIAMATARGNKIISKQIPFIVNKSFACEVYLKLILMENNISFNDLKGPNRHKLWELYSKCKDLLDSDFEKKMNLKGFRNIDKKIQDLSEAFMDWRYIYEKNEMVASLDFLFLDELCTYLDEKAKLLIMNNYNYDVNKDIR